MNKYQRLVVIVAAVNIALMLLFPPFLDNPMRRGVLPNFEGFYPLFSAYGVKRIHNELLTLQLMFVVINGLIAWLVLDRQTGKGELPEFRYTRAIGIFLAANLALPHADYFDGFWVDCAVCHTGSATPAAAGRCVVCHPERTSGLNLEMPTVKVAIHRSCWKCHERGTGSEASSQCGFCHQRPEKPPTQSTTQAAPALPAGSATSK